MNWMVFSVWLGIALAIYVLCWVKLLRAKSSQAAADWSAANIPLAFVGLMPPLVGATIAHGHDGKDMLLWTIPPWLGVSVLAIVPLMVGNRRARAFDAAAKQAKADAAERVLRSFGA